MKKTFGLWRYTPFEIGIYVLACGLLVPLAAGGGFWMAGEFGEAAFGGAEQHSIEVMVKAAAMMGMILIGLVSAGFIAVIWLLFISHIVIANMLTRLLLVLEPERDPARKTPK